MANTNRRIIDRTGSMFIPMNMEGNNWNDRFWTTPKLVTIGALLFSIAYITFTLSANSKGFASYLVFYIIWIIVAIYSTRYIIFEEKFYYRMYKQRKKDEITTPALFWDIASTKDTPHGAIITYSDGKVGVMVKLERDTITGKPDGFRETHYDAVSDFYHKLLDMHFKFIHMNIMEPAGNDPRLAELDKLVTKDPNPNVQKLMSLEIGYIKNNNRKTLYETDMFLIYTSDTSRVDTIIEDVEECLSELLRGAYIGYTFLNSREELDYIKDSNGVSYFNRTDATLEMFRKNGMSTAPTFNITGFIDNQGQAYGLNKAQAHKIKNLAMDVDNNKHSRSDIALKDTVLEKENKLNKRITFESILGQGGTTGEKVGHGVANVSTVSSLQVPSGTLGYQPIYPPADPYDDDPIDF